LLKRSTSPAQTAPIPISKGSVTVETGVGVSLEIVGLPGTDVANPEVVLHADTTKIIAEQIIRTGMFLILMLRMTFVIERCP